MTFSDEPGVYIPGEFGVRLEDDMHILDDGAELFTPQSPSLEDPFAKVTVGQSILAQPAFQPARMVLDRRTHELIRNRQTRRRARHAAHINNHRLRPDGNALGHLEVDLGHAHQCPGDPHEFDYRRNSPHRYRRISSWLRQLRDERACDRRGSGRNFRTHRSRARHEHGSHSAARRATHEAAPVREDARRRLRHAERE